MSERTSDTAAFDAYYSWLGIAPEEQPPNHYRLLGIRPFESDPGVIENAADRQLQHVRNFQLGPHSAESQPLLNEIAAARACLLNAESKTAYDEALRTQLASQNPPPVASQQPTAPRSARPRQRNPLIELAKIVLGGVAGIALGTLLLWYGFGKDVFGIMSRHDDVAANLPAEVPKISSNTTQHSSKVESPSTLPESTQVDLDEQKGIVENQIGESADDGSSKPDAQLRLIEPSVTAEATEAATDIESDVRKLLASQDVVLHLSFDAESIANEGGRRVLRDQSRRGNHGTVFGAAVDANGRIGSAFRIDGVDDYIEFPSLREDLTAELRELSIACWVKQDPQKLGFMFDVGFVANSSISILTRRGASFTFALPTDHGGIMLDTSPVTPSEWHHMVAIWNEHGQHFYVDGMKNSTASTGQNFRLTSETVTDLPARLGTMSKSEDNERRFFRGLLDEFVIFTRALTDDDIALLYRHAGVNEVVANGAEASPGTLATGAKGKESPSPATVKPAAREPVPSDEQISASQENVRSVFSEDYEFAKKASDKSLLAAKLLKVGLDATDNMADRFVVLRSARNIAVEAGDVALAFDSVREICKSFNVDRVAEQTRLAQDLAKAAITPTELDKFRLRIAETIDEALDSGLYAAAQELIDVARAISRGGDKQWNDSVERWQSHLEAASAAYEALQSAQETLKVSPDDADANAAAGRYYCLIKGDWDRGLRFLAKGSDSVLRELAARELSAPSSAEERLKLADGWWGFAGAVTGLPKLQVQRRAGTLYRRLVQEVTGVANVKVEKRLAEINAAGIEIQDVEPVPASALEIDLSAAVSFLNFEPASIAGGGEDYIRIRGYAPDDIGAVLRGAAIDQNGKVGAALYLDGSDDWVQLDGLRSRILRNNNALTMAFWLKSEKIKRMSVVFDLGHHATRAISLTWELNRPVFCLPIEHGGHKMMAKIESDVVQSEWQHVACVWTGTEQQLYLNGELVATEATPHLTLSSDTLDESEATLGRHALPRRGGEQRLFGGWLDEFVVFGRPLSKREVMTLVELGTRGSSLAAQK